VIPWLIMRILAIALVDGDLERVRELRTAVEAERPDALVCAGGIGAPAGAPEATSLHRVVHELAALPCPVAVVPGEEDAPEHRVLPILASQEWTEHHLYCVHGMHAVVRELAIAGFGGAIVERDRETETALRDPSWEAKYRLAFLTQLDQPLLVLAFHHPPAQVRTVDLVDGVHAGSEAVTELIGTWNPRVAVVAGASPATETYADTVVVSPGRLDRGEYALVDTRGAREVRFASTSAPTRSQA
jgi:uncharacterized protein